MSSEQFPSCVKDGQWMGKLVPLILPGNCDDEMRGAYGRVYEMLQPLVSSSDVRYSVRTDDPPTIRLKFPWATLVFRATGVTVEDAASPTAGWASLMSSPLTLHCLADVAHAYTQVMTNAERHSLHDAIEAEAGPRWAAFQAGKPIGCE